MLYISTQVRRKWPQKTWQMECSATLPQPATQLPGISPTLPWTDADSLTLEQICKDLGISETELDPCRVKLWPNFKRTSSQRRSRDLAKPPPA